MEYKYSFETFSLLYSCKSPIVLIEMQTICDTNFMHLWNQIKSNDRLAVLAGREPRSRLGRNRHMIPFLQHLHPGLIDLG